MEPNKSFWAANTSGTTYPSLRGDKTVDAIIVGAGITGLTAAYRLAQAGRKVAVLEKFRVGGGETGLTTAHLTQAVDARYPALKAHFGAEGARVVASCGARAISFIEETLQNLGEEAGFERVPGYLYSEFSDGVDALRRELEAAREAGVPVTWEEHAPLPFSTCGAVKYANQAQVQPLLYLRALASAIVARGGLIFENTMVTEFSDGNPVYAASEAGTIQAGALFIATNTPVSNRILLHTKLAAYRSYAVAFEPVRVARVNGLFWDLDDPYHYTRSARAKDGHRDGKLVYIVGGEDHKTGEITSTEECYRRLERYCEARFGIKQKLHQWSGQIIDSVDGLPFIGRNSVSLNEYVAAGYAGNGMTFGTVAGLLVSDLMLGRENTWESLFRATRIKPLSSAVDYVSENVDFPRYFIEDRLRRPAARSPEDVLPGEGKLVEKDGQTVAAYRDENGKLSLLSPVCPHLGCRVHFNSSEKSWDCPCHGSRFSTDGKCLNGPAISGLSPVKETKRKGAA